MKQTVWALAAILENHGNELTALLLELYNQTGLGPEAIDYADALSKFDGFGWQDLTPGAHIRLHWQAPAGTTECPAPVDENDEPAAFSEDGYVFTLPSMEGNDVAMAGLVHIPNPTNWGGHGDIEPHWVTLNRLVAIEHLVRIELLRTVR